MNGKKLFFIFLSVIMMLSFSTVVAFADEGNVEGNVDFRLQERYEDVMRSMREGQEPPIEDKIILEDGTILHVTATDAVTTNSVMYASNATKVTSREIMFQVETSSGALINGFSVKVTCAWNENGQNSEIISFETKVQSYTNGFTFQWDSPFGGKTYRSRGLTATYYGVSHYYIFDALINTLVVPPTCSISYTSH